MPHLDRGDEVGGAEAERTPLSPSYDDLERRIADTERHSACARLLREHPFSEHCPYGRATGDGTCL